MNSSTQKFTRTEEEIMDFLFLHPTTEFRGRALARELKKSASGVIKSMRNLEKRGLIHLKEDFTLSIGLDRENKQTFILKRIANIKFLYESGLVAYLSDAFLGSTIIVFGSYSYGEDTEDSDIDMAIIGYPEKNMNDKELIKYEKYLQRKVQLHFFKDMKNIHKNLKDNIVNGIVLEGAIKL